MRAEGTPLPCAERTDARRGDRARLVLAAGLIAALALAAAQTARTSVAGAAKFSVDHYACYPAHLAGGQHPQVKIKNQFGSGTLAVGTPSSVCAPASKNGATVLNKTAHLVCYAVKVVEPQAPNSHRVVITNQFGAQQMTVVVNPPQTLCLPSSKSVTSAPPGPVPKNLDHYVCYRVDPGQFAAVTVKVADQFGTSSDTVVRALSLCVPTSKNGSTMIQSATHLLCYQLTSQSHGKRLALANQFGTLKGSLATRNRLCVPSTKKVLT